MTKQPIQRFVIDLPISISRRALDVVQTDGSYRNLSELVSVALENQLQLDSVEEEVDPHLSGSPYSGIQSKVALAKKTPASVDVDLIDPAHRAGGGRENTSPRRAHNSTKKSSHNRSAFWELSDEVLLDVPDLAESEGDEPMPGKLALSPFTNRLTPLVVPARVLVNGAQFSAYPTVDEFLERTPQIARTIGLWLKEEDLKLARRGRLRRSTAWPVGSDERSSLTRFRKSFLLTLDGPRFSGPLVELGLVTVKDDRVLPTSRTISFAKEKTPLLGETSDPFLLSAAQQSALRTALMQIEEEGIEIAAFLRAIREAAGNQALVDHLIGAEHPQWSEAQVVSHRAAMLGRLRDVGVLDISTPKPGDDPLIAVFQDLDP